MKEPPIREQIDTRGMYCPGPLMELISALKLIEAGDEIELLSSDKGTEEDLPIWLDKVGHELVKSETHEGYTSFVIRKKK
jgi:TusA-related sulfurtransferase